MNKPGICVIGAGFIGSKHAETYAQSSRCHLISVCDAEASRAGLLAKRLGCSAITDWRAALEDPKVHAVSVCLPEDAHTLVTVGALTAGKSVLLEKPMATTLDDCDRMIEASQANQAILMIAHLLRFDARYAQAYHAIRQGEIGDIVHIVCQRNGMFSAQRDTSLLFHVGIHDYDVALWMSNSKPKSIFSAKVVKDRTVRHTEESVFSLIEFADGSMATVGSSWSLPDDAGSQVNSRLEVLGTNGLIRIEGGVGPTLAIFGKSGWRYPDVFHWPVVAGATQGCLRQEIEHFLACVGSHREPAVSVHESKEAVQTVLAAIESFNKKTPFILEGGETWNSQ